MGDEIRPKDKKKKKSRFKKIGRKRVLESSSKCAKKSAMLWFKKTNANYWNSNGFDKSKILTAALFMVGGGRS